MIHDQEPYKRIGRHIVEILPNTWEQVIFHLFAEDEKVFWNAEYSLKGADGQIKNKMDLKQNSELLNELENLRGTALCPLSASACELIFHSNGKFETRIIKTKPDIKSPDLNEVKETIEKLKSINLAVAEIDDLKEYLRTLNAGYTLESPFIYKDTILYRGVKWRDKPQNVSDLSYPPVKYVKNLHRAGRSDQPLFYCSTVREAPFFELEVVPGDQVAISHWRTTAQIIVNNVGYHDDVFNYLQSMRNCPTWGEDTQSKENDEGNASVRHFFATEFAKIVPSGQEFLYKMSIAIAELHFSHNLFGGLLYPSIAMRANADNIVLKPQCVDQHLKLHKVEFVRIEESIENGYKITILDFANEFGSNGGILWKGRHPHWVLREREKALKVAVENGRWVARNEEDQIVEPE